MAYSEALAERLRETLTRFKGVSERKMFGGVAFLVNGNMCVGVVNDDLMVRVGPDAYENARTQPHAREMDFTGKPMKGMVYVDTKGIAKDKDLAAWVDRGMAFAGNLPPKKPRKPKKPPLYGKKTP